MAALWPRQLLAPARFEVTSFLNQPELRFEYSGLARHVDSTILQTLIESAVASSLVFPRACLADTSHLDPFRSI